MKYILILLAIFLTACDHYDDDGEPNMEGQDWYYSYPEGTSYPLEVKGKLKLDLEMGEIAEDGIASYTNGDLITQNGTILVSIESDVLRKTLIRREDELKYVEVEGLIGSFEIIEGSPQTTMYSLIKLSKAE